MVFGSDGEIVITVLDSRCSVVAGVDGHVNFIADNDDHVEDSLNTTLKDALRVSNVGIIVYDDNYEL